MSRHIESFIGQSVAVNPSYFAFTGAVMDLGYDNPLDVVDWKVYSSYEEALAEATKSYGAEAPDFYEAQQKFFDENDK